MGEVEGDTRHQQGNLVKCEKIPYVTNRLIISNEVGQFRLVTVRLYEVLLNLMWETEVASLAR